MSRFATGQDLKDSISDIIQSAKTSLLIVSPFIKLDDHFKKLIDTCAADRDIRITVLFGKNEERPSRSMSASDIEYFKKFHNVSIIYVPTLHAKYYGNERQGVITSLNLYDYSLKHNIEFGVFSEVKMIDDVVALLGQKNTDTDAYEYSMRLAHTHDVVFARRPRYQQNLADKFANRLSLGLVKSRHLFNSEVIVDHTEALLRGWNYASKRLADIPAELEIGELVQASHSVREPEPAYRSASTSAPAPSYRNSQNSTRQQSRPNQGYCIRTGEVIDFNPERPFSYSAWKSWANFSNVDYPERFCHLTGQPSHGRTSMRNPIMSDK